MQHVDVFCVQGLQKLLHHTAADIDSKQVTIPKNLNIYSEIQGYQLCILEWLFPQILLIVGL